MYKQTAHANGRRKKNRRDRVQKRLALLVRMAAGRQKYCKRRRHAKSFKEGSKRSYYLIDRTKAEGRERAQLEIETDTQAYKN